MVKKILFLNIKAMGNTRSKINKSKMTETIAPVPNKVRICQKCQRLAATRVRKFDLENVPKRYILNPNNISYSFIISEYKVYGYNGWMSDSVYLVDLPKEHVLTKYSYYVCDNCYEKEKEPLCVWNHWEKY
jgi:hypothetical protein